MIDMRDFMSIYLQAKVQSMTSLQALTDRFKEPVARMMTAALTAQQSAKRPQGEQYARTEPKR